MLNWIKQHKTVLLIAAAVVAVLVIAFISGGSIGSGKDAAPSTVPATAATGSTTPSSSQTTQPTATSAVSTQAATSAPTTSTTAATAPSQPSASAAPQSKTSSPAATSPAKQEQSRTSAAPSKQPTPSTTAAPQPTKATDPSAEKPKPVDPQEHTITPVKKTCTVSISCQTALAKKAQLDDSVAEVIPSDGVILSPVKVVFNEGESVFDVLSRVCKIRKIHMEFTDTPVYHSAYIEGIGNLYEFDCGSGSGWMYRVNGWFPNYGCSRYAVKSGDVIEWLYTCDLGRDIGGENINYRD